MMMIYLVMFLSLRLSRDEIAWVAVFIIPTHNILPERIGTKDFAAAAAVLLFNLYSILIIFHQFLLY